MSPLICSCSKFSLAMQSYAFRDFLLPSLYETVSLKSSRKCRVTLTMLADRPDICAHIRKFAVRPNYYLSWPKPDEPLDEDWVVHRIEDIAPYLTSMHTFDWDGLEMPLDRLWGTFQASYVILLFRFIHFFHHFARCPNLRNVSSNVGAGPLNPDSKVIPVACQRYARINSSSSSLTFPTSRASPSSYATVSIYSVRDPSFLPLSFPH